MKSHADLIFSNPSDIADYDVDLRQAMQDESIRQEDHIELIASENYASKRVLEAQGSLLTNNMPKVTQIKDIMGAVNLLI